MEGVSVIIPTFNRAHLLNKTVPTYLQEGVKEVILVDDCSTDDTEKVVKELSQKYTQIIYIKAPKKVLQVGAKNIGKKVAKSDYIYFGDDDSVLKPGSIQSLLKICKNNPQSLVGARHHYMTDNENLDTILKDNVISDISNLNKFLDKKKVRINSYPKYDSVVEVPFCQACFMLSRKIAQKQDFYEGYTGICNREETDYIMQVCQNFGFNVLLDNEALSVDLPRSVTTGGTRNVKALKRKTLAVFNEYNFWKRNKAYLSKITNRNPNPFLRALL